MDRTYETMNQELFPRPNLKVTALQPTEGNSVNLSCETHLPPERLDTPLHFIFFRDDRIVLSSWSNFSGLQIPTIWREDSGWYRCGAATVTSSIQKLSSPREILVQRVPVSQVSLETHPPGGQAIEGEMLVLVCSVAEGTGVTTFSWHRENTSESLGRKTQRSQRAELEIPVVRGSHGGGFYCTANNSYGPVQSQVVNVTVRVPVSRPVLTLRVPSVHPVVGDVMELHCEALSGSPPILYTFYHEDVTLGSTMAPSGGGASFNLSLMEKHSGNYSCEAENDLGIQHSELVTVIVTVPVSCPVLTLRAPRAQAAVGDVVELHCEALRGSPPILYQFYLEDVTLGNSSAPSGGGASFNLSLTAEHSGNYSCEADNGQGAQRSEVVALFIPGLTESRSGPVAPGVSGGLLGTVVLAAGALLFYHWLSRKAGGRTASDPSRRSSDSNPQDPTYHNVPGWIELQPVYMNVKSRGEDVVYSEVSCLQKESRNSAASAHSLSHQTDSSVIYAKVKKACTPASGPHQLTSPAPHR
ncbi:Fc receptor-like protein 3 [Callospermophilus lateralis]|uniref:Fc receptor-like protein 3 n=1 Tax=Callospermophilus lateralis TaxID=76772 RepID=UPI004038AEC3